MKEGRAKIFPIPAPQAGQLRKLAAAGRSSSVILINGLAETDRPRLVADLSRIVDRPVERVPLAQVVSRYIGETEKNLVRRFVMAQRTGAILLFDEADALFGKRSEVSDSHDRYANLQAGHLLAVMEQYEGLVMLATSDRVTVDAERARFLLWVLERPDP